MSRLHHGGVVATFLALALMLAASHSDAATFRYRQSGDWTAVTDGPSPGWGLNPNNDGVTPGPGLPGASDVARVNWGGNTVTVTSSVPAVQRVQIGVDESGIVEVNNGGVLTAVEDILAGNNNPNAKGTLVVNDGGVVDVGRILWSANNDSDGAIDVRSGGVINVASHLWWGVSGTATIDIAGVINQTGGILGLGTNDASTPGGGTATVNILDGGVLALNNISGNPGLPSIQTGSSINIEGSGELILPGDFVGLLTEYAEAELIGGAGVPGLANLVIDMTRNPGSTTVYLVPEPSGWLLLATAAGVVGRIRRR